LPTPPRMLDTAGGTDAPESPPPADAGPEPGPTSAYQTSVGVGRGRPELDPEVRALATRFVASVTGRVCRDAGRRAGVSSDKLAAVADHATDPRFLPDERAALAYAAALSGADGGRPDDLLAELRRHFSERGIVELIVAVAMAHGRERGVAPLAVETAGCLALPRPVPAGAGAA